MYRFDSEAPAPVAAILIQVGRVLGIRSCDLPPVVVPNFKLGWGSSQARDPGGE